MSKHGAPFTAMFIAIATAAIVAMMTASASAQSTTTGNDSGSLPVSFLIDNAMSAHAQDIKDRMLDYEFNHTTSDAVKANIVKERGDDLNEAALDQQALLEALNNDSNRGLITADRMNAMLNMTKGNLMRMSRSSNDLQEKAQKIKGHTDSGSIDPLIMNINTATSLADNISRGNAYRGNIGIARQNQPPKHPDNPKINK